MFWEGGVGMIWVVREDNCGLLKVRIGPRLFGLVWEDWS